MLYWLKCAEAEPTLNNDDEIVPAIRAILEQHRQMPQLIAVLHDLREVMFDMGIVIPEDDPDA